MELMGAIAGLESLKKPCNVTLYSDSQYLVNAINQNWVQKWKENNWLRDIKRKYPLKTLTFGKGSCY